MVSKSMVLDQKKFMWDGNEYPDRAAAEGKMAEYKGSDFEVALHEEGGKFFVFTRRVVTEIVVEGGGP